MITDDAIELAPTTAPYQPTPNPTPAPVRSASLARDRRASDILFYSDPGHASGSDSDSGELPPAPRLSMNLNELDDDSFLNDEPEPRFSVPLEDLDHTHQSIEFGRRAVSEQPWGGRASFGIRLSDRFADFGTGAESDVGEETVGEVSVMVGDESELRVGGLDEGSERMAFVGDEEEGDVTMREELELDPEEDSYFLTLPTADDTLALEDETEDEDQDEDGQAQDMLPDYDIQTDPATLEDETNLAHARRHPDPKPLTAPKRTKKPLPLSRHGHPVPVFPRAVIKKMAQNFTGGAQISNETLNAIVTASEAFFEQVSDDLAVYAGHAGRKTIEDADVIQLLKRYRVLSRVCELG